MISDSIIIKGARQHNLRNINLKLPRNKFIVITGLSGSGKSSLAFDTIYAEGQRRYVESLSSYARQFLGQMTKPDVDSIEGLSPAISIEQQTTHHNPRSIVGTTTEIYDYFRLLWARIGIPHCTTCGQVLKKQSSSSIIKHIMRFAENTRFMILAPLVRGKKGEYQTVFNEAKKEGFIRMRVDGNIIHLIDDPLPKLNKKTKHTIEVVVDRLNMKPAIKKRLSSSIETALRIGDGTLTIVTDTDEVSHSINLACPDGHISLDSVEPRMFSFNTPYGACSLCSGLGTVMEFDSNLIIPDTSLTLSEGAIKAPGWNTTDGWSFSALKSLSKIYSFSLNTPWKKLSKKVKNILLYGSQGKRIKFSYSSDRFNGDFFSEFEGIINSMKRRYRETKSPYMQDIYRSFMMNRPCEDCGGERLKPESRAITIQNKSIMDITRMSIIEAKNFFDALRLTKKEFEIARLILKEISARLKFLSDVGLGYLTLDRPSGTLSGGENQRVRLATQIGSGLVGVTYILDEPSIGLHQRDNTRLLNSLLHLRDIGNTLIVVEHDEQTIRQSDWVVDLGPKAGVHGGDIVAEGTPHDIINVSASYTGQFLNGTLFVDVPQKRRSGNGKKLTIHGAAEHNLQNIDVDFPLGTLICITGVSGSGKSTLINEILYRELARLLNRARTHGGQHKSISGIEHLDKVINIDQSPIGRTPRSNPVTYTGCFTPIRELFARIPESKIRGYQPGRFSFNVPVGRCERCEGQGLLCIEMHFLPDVYVLCEECNGSRYNDETLEIKYKGKSIADVLKMTVEDALDFFNHIPKIKNKLQTLNDVGLGYIKLGQSATTLSGGEAQRIKLAAELSKRSTGKTLYLLDEPTTGLHFYDVKNLLTVLNRFADNGNTVIVIEHNLDVIKQADHVIDLGPEGGIHGGKIIAQGTPEDIAQNKKSFTGKYLKPLLT